MKRKMGVLLLVALVWSGLLLRVTLLTPTKMRQAQRELQARYDSLHGSVWDVAYCRDDSGTAEVEVVVGPRDTTLLETHYSWSQGPKGLVRDSSVVEQPLVRHRSLLVMEGSRGPYSPPPAGRQAFTTRNVCACATTFHWPFPDTVRIEWGHSKAYDTATLTGIHALIPAGSGPLQRRRLTLFTRGRDSVWARVANVARDDHGFCRDAYDDPPSGNLPLATLLWRRWFEDETRTPWM